MIQKRQKNLSRAMVESHFPKRCVYICVYLDTSFNTCQLSLDSVITGRFLVLNSQPNRYSAPIVLAFIIFHNQKKIYIAL